MAVTVKKIVVWRTEVENRPGALSGVLAPLAEAGADLRVVMGYRYPGGEHKAAIEVCPVSGKKSTTAAGKAGLAASAIPTLLVQGDNRPGLGHAVAQAIADAEINVTFMVAQVIDARFSAVMGFENEAASKQAATLIKKAVTKIEKQLASSASALKTNGESPVRRSRILVLCRKKCDAALDSVCSDSLDSE
ncbi:MAG: hypothetical protein ABSG53_11035 [Thermoguttaceae bacterium]|jgi:hypothetical protein